MSRSSNWMMESSGGRVWAVWLALLPGPFTVHCSSLRWVEEAPFLLKL